MAILRLIGSVLVKKLFSRFLEEILSNDKLQKKLLFWLLENISKRTAATWDDELLILLRENIGDEPPETLEELLSRK